MDSNKNLIIGLLVTVVVLGVGYSIIKKTPQEPVVTPVVPIVTTPVVTNPTPTQPLKAGAPYATTDTMVSTTSSTAVVSGQANPNGSGTSYWFEYGETTSMGNRTSMQAIGSGFSNISAPGFITGLKTNTLYYFRLSTKNSFATVNGTQYTFRTNTTPPVQGMAPTVTTTAASNIKKTTATLSGKVNPNGVQTSYWFEYSENATLATIIGSGTAEQTLGAGSVLTTVHANSIELKPNTRYYYRVVARNNSGTTTGNIATFKTQP